MTRGIVTVAGSFAVGLTLRSSRFPAAGETVLARDFDLWPGGKGSNQAVQIARMGERVELVGMIGTDDFGDIAVDMIPLETAAAALAAAREEGAVAVLNPAPARELGPSVLEDVDILTPNQTEARILAGLAPDDPIDDLDACAELMRRGVATVVLTRGPRGASIFTTEGVERVDAFPVEVVDSTGAGDAFNGTLATALAQGTSLSEAARRACGAGALACTKLGVVPALPTVAELDEFLA